MLYDSFIGQMNCWNCTIWDKGFFILLFGKWKATDLSISSQGQKQYCPAPLTVTYSLELTTHQIWSLVPCLWLSQWWMLLFAAPCILLKMRTWFLIKYGNEINRKSFRWDCYMSITEVSNQVHPICQCFVLSYSVSPRIFVNLHQRLFKL